MTRVQNILNTVRLELGDYSSLRYSDTVLLTFLNNGIQDFVLATKCLKERVFVGLASNIAIYDIKDYAMFVERVEYMNKRIPTLSYKELDSIDDEWQYKVGDEVEIVSFEHFSKGKFRIYPMLDNIESSILHSSDYGILVDFTIDEDITNIPDISDVEQNLNKYLVLYTIKKPNIVTVDTLDEDLEVDSSYDRAFMHYIKASCLRSDTDANNRAYGNEERAAYTAYITSSNLDFTLDNQTASDRVIEYRGFI